MTNLKKTVSSTTYRLNIVRIYARNVPRVHGLKHADDGATAASTIDWSSCAHSSVRRLSAILNIEYLILQM